MKQNELQAKLIAAAKSNPPSTSVPYAFEKRIMSRLAGVPAPDIWALWSGALLRAALACVAITALCGVWSYAAPHKTVSLTAENFPQDFEAAVLAPTNPHIEDPL